MRRWLKRAALAFLALAVLVAAALAGGRWWLQTDGGRAFIAGLARDAGVEMEGLAGDPFGRLTVDRIRVRDAEGVWLSAEDATVAWRPWALFGRRLIVEEIAAARIAVDRAPTSEPAAEPPPESAPLEAPPIAVEVRRLAVGEIALGEALAGTAARLKLDATAAYESAAAEARLSVDRLDGPGMATLDAGYALATDAFRLDLVVNDPPGGLAAGLVGLADGVEARLAGEGDLKAWKGALTARSGAVDLVDLALDLGRADGTIRVGVKGDISPGPLLPAEAEDPVGDKVGIDLAATAAEDGSAIMVERLALAAAAADLLASGRFAPETGALDVTIETTRIDPDAILKLAPGVSVEAPSLQARVTGAIDAPRATAVLRADRVAAEGAGASGLVVDIAAEPAGAATDVFDWRLSLTAETLQTGAPDVDGLLAEGLAGAWTVRGSGRYDPAASRLPVDVTVMRGEAVAVGFDGAADPAGAAQGRLTATVADLSAIAPLAGAPLAGPAELGTDVEFGPAGLALRDLTLRALDMALDGRVALDRDFANIDADLKLAAPDLGRTLAPFGAPVAGAANGTVTLSGPVGDPAAKGEIAFAPLVAGGERFPSARIRFDASTLASGPAGNVRATAASPYGDLAAETRFALAGDRLKLTGLSATAPGARAAGDLALDLATTVATGTITLDVRSLAEATAPFGVAASGAGGGRIRLGGGSGGQTVDANLAFDDAGAEGVAARRIAVTAKGALAGSAPLRAEVTVTGLDAGEATAETVSLTLDGPLSGAAVRFAANGVASGEPFEARLAGRLAVTDAGQRFRLESGGGAVAGAPFSLASGLEVRNDAKGLAVSGLALSSDPLDLAAGFSLAGDDVDLQISNASADFGALAKLMPSLTVAGELTASGRIRGPLTGPSGRIEIVGRDLRGTDDPEGPTIALDGALTLAPASLSVDLSGTGLGETPLTVKGSVGLAPNAGAPPAPAASSPLDFRVAWSGDLAPLVALAPLDDHRLVSAAKVDLTVGGTVGRPDARGAVVIGPGRYEHLDYGTTLDFDRIEIAADGERITLKPFTARAGEGALSASGNVLLDGAKGYPAELTARLDKARLVARDDVTASASGDLRFDNRADGMDVFARITTERVEVELIDSSPASIPTLAVEEVGPVPAGRKDEERGPPKPGPPIGLDVEVNIPGRFFVRGRGLESEWGGNVAVRGTAAKPLVTGQLDLRRGTFDIVGKRMELTEGSVRLEPDASERLEAIVDVLAEYEGTDFAADVRVAGPATDPKVTLSSTPDLPRDEILSRLLFNKNAGALTATESLQLAAAAASLATGGGGGGFDPVGMIRQATGIDTLRVDLDEGGEPTVEAGKYLTDDVYVGVKQGAGSDAGAVTVEVEVFDNVTIESEAKQDGSQKVGARLKWDY